MSDANEFHPGMISWHDLTVPNADEVRDFYADVVGWGWTPVSMGDYSDFSMNLPESGDPVSGVCYARGINANIPAQWLVYINVKNLDESIAKCVARGGAVIDGPRSMGVYRFCVIRDPAGAVAALIALKG